MVPPALEGQARTLLLDDPWPLALAAGMCANLRVQSPVQVGEIVAGKYRVESILGQGGMGVVVAAVDTILDRRVAVKFLLPQYAENEVAAGRFLREARATARLDSEHAVRIIEVGQLESGSPFMAMEFLQGVDLGTFLERQGPLSAKLAADYLLQACVGLGAAHTAGIIHRDVKPSNLFLAYQAGGKPLVKVLDFGVSKFNLGVDAHAGSLTTTGQTLGSPLYMSPEQMRSSHAADARSDIWGLGVVLFELLTGTRPFLADSLAELVLVINQEPPRDPKTLRPDLPDALCRVVLRCLEKDPAQRPQTVDELATALVPFGTRDPRPSSRNTRTPGTVVAGQASIGRMGTLIVGSTAQPVLSHLAHEPGVAAANSSVEPGAVEPGAGEPRSASTGEKTSAPWASTKEDAKAKRKATKASGVFLAAGLFGAAFLIGGAGVVFYAMTRPDEPDDSAIVSAASELSEASDVGSEQAGDDLEATPNTPTAVASVPATSASAASASTDTAEASPTAEGDPAPPKRVVPRRPDKPKTAKDRLGF